MKYEKRIAYLDYLEAERKIKNVGFAKFIVQGTQCRIWIQIRGLFETDTLRAEIMMLSNNLEKELDTILLKQGGGSLSFVTETSNLSGTGWDYEQLMGIRIRLSARRVIQAIWEPARVTIATEETNVRKPEETRVETEIEAKTEVEEAEMKIRAEETKIEAEPEVEAKIEEEVKIIAETEAEVKIIAETEEEELPVVSREPEEEPEIRTHILCDDKWKQLENTYSQIHPFGDKRVYLSIEPKDFLILTKEYHQMVNNSFLLHGYYNYHHILLGKTRENREEKFYLGVPGVYYEREKMVAIMFGFEKFESAQEPAEAGSFGYYMKKVEI